MCELFNCKIIQYANGTIEVRQYDRVINNHLLYMSEDELSECQKLGKERAKDDICEPNDVYNPFSDAVEPIMEFEQLDLLELRARRSINNSLNRTVHEIYKYSRQCKWSYFITLTFSEEKADRYNFTSCMQVANKWFGNQRARYANDLQYLFVPEQHKDGAWHIHGLIAQEDRMIFADSGHKFKSKTIYNLSGWKYGFSTATKVEDTSKVSSYITKYITKDLCQITKGKKRYYRSRNIPEPIETNFLLENDEKDSSVRMVIDGLGADCEYSKQVNGYVNVSYTYYKVKEMEGSGAK